MCSLDVWGEFLVEFVWIYLVSPAPFHLEVLEPKGLRPKHHTRASLLNKFPSCKQVEWLGAERLISVTLFNKPYPGITLVVT